MKKALLLLIMTVLAVSLAACGSKNEGKDTSAAGQAEKIMISHLKGDTEVPKNPQKVVVFDFGSLDTLDKLGVEVAALPKSGTLPEYLSKYSDGKYANVGSLKEPDFEKINELEPDLIIISARQAESYDEFTKIAPTIYLGVDNAKYMQTFKENVTKLAQIFGKEKEAETELAAIDASIKGLTDKTANLDKKALIILANEGKVSAYGAGSRFGIIHDVFGVKQADENIVADTHGKSISFEYIVEKNPDILFVVDRGAVMVGGKSSAQGIVENELVKTTKAYKEGNVVYLNPDFWYLSGGGLISVAEMTKEIDAGLK